MTDRDHSAEIHLSGKEGSDSRLGGVPPSFLGYGLRPIVALSANAKKASFMTLPLELNNLRHQKAFFFARTQRSVLAVRIECDQTLGVT